MMTERLVDVLHNGAVIHTYPVTLDESAGTAKDAEYEAKALQAAAQGRLVPNEELGRLSARMHVSRGGRMAAVGDDIAPDSETKAGLEQAVRERAYFLWENEGRPSGREEEFWQRALDAHLRSRAYALWQQSGSPEGGADEYWSQIRDFEAK